MAQLLNASGFQFVAKFLNHGLALLAVISYQAYLYQFVIGKRTFDFSSYRFG